MDRSTKKGYKTCTVKKEVSKITERDTYNVQYFHKIVENIKIVIDRLICLFSIMFTNLFLLLLF